jgi:hypothetical protein
VFKRAFVVGSLVVLALGCGGNKNKYLRKQAAQDLSCGESQLHLTNSNKAGAQVLAQGCGKHALYTYEKGAGAVRISEIEDDGAAEAKAVVKAPRGAAGAPPPPPPPPPPAH